MARRMPKLMVTRRAFSAIEYECGSTIVYFVSSNSFSTHIYGKARSEACPLMFLTDLLLYITAAAWRSGVTMIAR